MNQWNILYWFDLSAFFATPLPIKSRDFLLVLLVRNTISTDAVSWLQVNQHSYSVITD